MKTYSLDEIFPPKVEIKKSGKKLEILGNEKLMHDDHIFTFTIVYGFEKLENGFVIEPKNYEETLRIVREYLKEQNFEFIGDKETDESLERLDNRERQFLEGTRIGEAIKNTKEIVSIEIPHFSKNRTLRPYQMKCVQHMIQVPGGVANFSIPGSGKTTMTYAVYDNLKSHSIIDQLLVVGPLSSFKPWEEEFTNCFDKPYKGNVLRYVGKPRERERLQNEFDEYEIILTNLPIVDNDYDKIVSHLFHNKKGDPKKIMLVLDESHHIKSFREDALYANRMIDLGKKSHKRIILTGTPLPHNWPDLWSQITFLYPDLRVFGSRINYKSLLDSINYTNEISEKMNFLWTRVTRKEMKDEMPELIQNPLLIPMSPLQEKIYRTIEREMSALEHQGDMDLYELQKERRIKSLRLLQCATNPATIRQPDIEFQLEPFQSEDISFMDELDNYSEIPEKMKKAVTLTTQLVKQEKNVIIWTVFRHNVGYLCKLFEEINLNAIGITGGIPMKTNVEKEIIGRDDLINYFKNNTGKILVATIGSVAESVSLHRNFKGEPVCQNAIYLERSFNAGQYMQSLFRLYRIGSDPKIPVINTFLMSTFADKFTRTIDDEVHERLNQRVKRMFDLMDDDGKLTPMDLDNEYFKDEDGLVQIYDKNENDEIIQRKIFEMIKKHQQIN